MVVLVVGGLSLRCEDETGFLQVLTALDKTEKGLGLIMDQEVWFNAVTFQGFGSTTHGDDDGLICIRF